MSKHGCGHCGTRFETHEALSDHIETCDIIKCGACDTEFSTHKEKIEHSPCDELGAVSDPEATFREERRKQKRRREFERRINKRNTLY
jgi:hypothetical protein